MDSSSVGSDDSGNSISEDMQPGKSAAIKGTDASGTQCPQCGSSNAQGLSAMTQIVGKFLTGS